LWHAIAFRTPVRFLAMNKFLPFGRDLRKLGVYELIRVPGPAQSCPATGAIRSCHPGNRFENHPTTDVCGGQDTRAWHADRRRIRPMVSRPTESALAARPVNGQRQARDNALAARPVYRQRHAHGNSESWYSKVVQISGKAKARADAPPQ
jgi:hypothetical protein